MTERCIGWGTRKRPRLCELVCKDCLCDFMGTSSAVKWCPACAESRKRSAEELAEERRARKRAEYKRRQGGRFTAGANIQYRLAFDPSPWPCKVGLPLIRREIEDAAAWADGTRFLVVRTGGALEYRGGELVRVAE